MKKSGNSDPQDLSRFKAKFLTTSYKVGNVSLPKESDGFRRLGGCPFFETFEDGRLSSISEAVLPFFRRYHLRRMADRPIKFSLTLDEFNRYLIANGHCEGENFYTKCSKSFLNFYSLFHPAKRYRVIMPFFPYVMEKFYGCSECVLDTPHGVRLYQYNFTEEGITSDDLNQYGFSLQLAARAFHLKSGTKPVSMGLVYPYTKDVVYYNYKEDEKLEELFDVDVPSVRRYGEYCGVCLRRHCSPLIDEEDKYGWPAAYRSK